VIIIIILKLNLRVDPGHEFFIGSY
jgi:hypothetical protein